MSAWGSVARHVLRSGQPHPRRTASTISCRARAAERYLHVSTTLSLPRRRGFFSSNVPQKQQNHTERSPELDVPEETVTKKRRSNRAPGAKTSLRRVAVEAQRSRDEAKDEPRTQRERELESKTVTAYCVAERFNLSKALRILRAQKYTIDPFKTGLYPQVIHFQVSHTSQTPAEDEAWNSNTGDIFVFPSGTVVAWAVPRSLSSQLVTTVLLPAAESPHLLNMETEDLDFVEDSTKENSIIKGDTILIGTKGSNQLQESGTTASEDPELRNTDTTLAKIAFSSGLARSTKLAVLETLLDDYFDSTRSIPVLLSKGSRLPFTRSFILRKTGQLLSIRAQLNLYSELTDSLPDLFWDSRHDLGLEGYFDQVGRALDVGIRIKTLNEKMDYAQEIASVLRERLSERHGLVLEWMIIALIAVEVGFEILRLIKERNEGLRRSMVKG